MSAGKRGGRFSYLTGGAESSETEPQNEAGEQENDGGSSVEGEEPITNTDSSSGGGGEGRSRTPKSRSRASSTQELQSVPKGTGRMKQERSQLNVRIPTTLKRRASAKAVLEGRDIGEVVEALLREYLDR